MTTGFRLEPITPGLGATVRGLDLRDPLGSDVVEDLRAAWLEHLVLWFPDQPITLEAIEAVLASTLDVVPRLVMALLEQDT